MLYVSRFCCLLEVYGTCRIAGIETGSGIVECSEAVFALGDLSGLDLGKSDILYGQNAHTV